MLGGKKAAKEDTHKVVGVCFTWPSKAVRGERVTSHVHPSPLSR